MDQQWPNGAKAAICFTMDNMGEAADLDRDLWPASQPIGSHYSVTEILPQFLDLLQKYEISGTYFAESWNLGVYPDAIQRLSDAGHEVAWHAFRHEAWSKLDQQAEAENFARSFGEKEGITGFLSRLADDKHGLHSYQGFRPPGGIIHGERTLKLCRDYGLEYVSPSAEQAAVVEIDGGRDRIAILPFKWRGLVALIFHTES